MLLGVGLLIKKTAAKRWRQGEGSGGRWPPREAIIKTFDGKPVDRGQGGYRMLDTLKCVLRVI